MMIFQKIKRFDIRQISVAVLILTLALSSCKQEFARMIPDREYNDSVSVTYGTPKVLYIIVDGARGLSVRDAKSPNISALLPNSIYSWVSLSDETVDQAGTSWADMLTGVQKSKHGVVDNDFSNKKLDAYPVIYERIKEANPSSDIRVFTTSELFKDNLTAGSDESAVLASDAAVKDAVIAGLNDDSVSFLTAHFSSVDVAGTENGYDLSNPGYKAAITEIDTYIGEMISAMRDRPDYERESWLVVITSSRGGEFTLPDDQNDNTVFSNPDVNTFTIFHTNRYRTRFIGKPYLGNRYQGDFLRLNGQRKAQVVAGDNSVYNLGSGEFTIELKVKKNIGPNNNYKFYYPAILGKRPEWSSGWPSNGWVVFLEDDYWMFNARGTSGGEQVRGDRLSDATWNSIAVVGVIRDAKRYVRTFTNGNFNTERDITGWGSIENSALMTLGYIAGNGHREPDAYVSDVRIWKAALPDSVINRFACETYIDPGHPYYDYLAGYWPVQGDTGDGLILDEGPLGSHMQFSGGDASWDRLSEYMCAPTVDDLGALVPRNVDVPAQIISWLRISRQDNWQLDGRVWLDQ